MKHETQSVPGEAPPVSSELPAPLPCPFCGESEMLGVDGDVCSVICNVCRASGPFLQIDEEPEYETEEEYQRAAIERWNRRSYLALVQEVSGIKNEAGARR